MFRYLLIARPFLVAVVLMSMIGLVGGVAIAQPPAAADQPPAEDGDGTAAKSGSDEDSADVPADGADAEKPPELTEDEKKEIAELSGKAYAEFEKSVKQLSDHLMNMREIHIRFADEVDQSKAAKDRFSEERILTHRKLRETYLKAMEFVQYANVSPEREKIETAARYMVTLLQNYASLSIYDLEVLNGAEQMIFIGTNYTYLVQAAGRSAMVTGYFDQGKRWLEMLDEEHREQIDRSLLGATDILREQWDIEQEKFERDADKSLPRVRMKTSRGEFVIELYLEDAPSTVSHFIRLCEKGYFDGLDFYQVIDDLLALAGDQSGAAGGGEKLLLDEHVRPGARHALRGSLLMAKRPIPDTGNFVPNTGGSQFAIMMMPAPLASRQQTVFGRVVEGMDVVCTLRRVDPSKEKKKGEVVVPPDYILSTEVIERPESLPEPVYFDPANTSAAGAHAGHDHGPGGHTPTN